MEETKKKIPEGVDKAKHITQIIREVLLEGRGRKTRLGKFLAKLLIGKNMRAKIEESLVEFEFEETLRTEEEIKE